MFKTQQIANMLWNLQNVLKEFLTQFPCYYFPRNFPAMLLLGRESVTTKRSTLVWEKLKESLYINKSLAIYIKIVRRLITVDLCDWPNSFALLQARIHTGFHRFTEIGQIFHNKYFFNNKKHSPSLNLGNFLPKWLENPGKGTYRVKKQNVSWGSPTPGIPLDSTWAFGPRLGNRSVFILDPRLYFLGKDAKRLPALRRMPRIVSA